MHSSTFLPEWQLMKPRVPASISFHRISLKCFNYWLKVFNKASRSPGRTPFSLWNHFDFNSDMIFYSTDSLFNPELELHDNGVNKALHKLNHQAACKFTCLLKFSTLPTPGFHGIPFQVSCLLFKLDYMLIPLCCASVHPHCIMGWKSRSQFFYYTM